jgi:hypothetical protein
MARVNVEEIIDHLDNGIRNALESAVIELFPKLDIDKYELFRAFKKAVRSKLNSWEYVPDNYVQKD